MQQRHSESQHKYQQQHHHQQQRQLNLGRESRVLNMAQCLNALQLPPLRKHWSYSSHDNDRWLITNQMANAISISHEIFENITWRSSIWFQWTLPNWYDFGGHHFELETEKRSTQWKFPLFASFIEGCFIFKSDVQTATGCILKTKPHLVKLNDSIFFNRWIFQPTLVDISQKEKQRSCGQPLEQQSIILIDSVAECLGNLTEE